MSSTNKTPLGLSQWDGTDKPKREDFNADNLLVDQILQSKADISAPGETNWDSGNLAIEQGDWVPAISSGAFTISAISVAKYFRVGSFVSLYLRANFTVTDRTSTQTLEISGIPYPYAVAGIDASGSATVRGAASLGSPRVMVTASGVLYFKYANSAGDTIVNGSSWGSTNTQSILASIIYNTESK